jgi:hypothetical protein
MICRFGLEKYRLEDTPASASLRLLRPFSLHRGGVIVVLPFTIYRISGSAALRLRALA